MCTSFRRLSRGLRFYVYIIFDTSFDDVYHLCDTWTPSWDDHWLSFFTPLYCTWYDYLLYGASRHAIAMNYMYHGLVIQGDDALLSGVATCWRYEFMYDGIVVWDLSTGEREINEVFWHGYTTQPCAFTRDFDESTIVYSVWLWYSLLRPLVQLGTVYICRYVLGNVYVMIWLCYFRLRPMIETGVLFTVCRYVLDTVCVTIVWIDFISDFAQEYKWGIVYVCPYVPGLFTGVYDDMTRVYYFCYFISFVSFMMSRDSHPLCSVKLTDQGHELLEWNVRGRCASALRAANAIANKLSPLLQMMTCMTLC